MIIRKIFRITLIFVLLTSVGFLAGGISGPMLMVWDKYPNQDAFERKSELLERQLIQIRSGRNVNWSENLVDLASDDKFILSALHQIKMTELDATEYLYDYFKKEGLPGGYIDIVDSDTAIFANGLGDLALLNLSNLSIIKIESNLKEIVDSQNYRGIVIPGLRGRFGLRDILVDRDKIYVSLFLDITGDGCYGLGILESPVANIKTNQASFEQLFATNECNRNFNGHASGGRMKFLNDELIFTVGSFDLNMFGDRSVPQDKMTAVGKVIAIKDDMSYRVLSMGHRNQQGLEIVNEDVFITEHGPMGGDEINMVKNGHYGWPFYAYGFDYDYIDKFKMPHQAPYIKPSYYFTPSIGISELIFYKHNRFSRWNEKFIVSSLVDKSIFLMDFDLELKRFISSERIYIGSRIRDLTQTVDGRLLFITDDQKILVLTSTVSDL